MHYICLKILEFEFSLLAWWLKNYLTQADIFVLKMLSNYLIIKRGYSCMNSQFKIWIAWTSLVVYMYKKCKKCIYCVNFGAFQIETQKPSFLKKKLVKYGFLKLYTGNCIFKYYEL